MAANRAEIAVRIMRAGTELNMATVGVCHGGPDSAHRWCADQSFLLPARDTPVGAYLDPKSIVDIVEREGVEVVHPGYGFLSESELARLCSERGNTFPRGTDRREFTLLGQGFGAEDGHRGERARRARHGQRADTAKKRQERSLEEFGLPVMIKALMGGGGKGMRIARTLDEVESQFEKAHVSSTGRSLHL